MTEVYLVESLILDFETDNEQTQILSIALKKLAQKSGLPLETFQFVHWITDADHSSLDISQLRQEGMVFRLWKEEPFLAPYLFHAVINSLLVNEFDVVVAGQHQENQVVITLWVSHRALGRLNLLPRLRIDGCFSANSDLNDFEELTSRLQMLFAERFSTTEVDWVGVAGGLSNNDLSGLDLRLSAGQIESCSSLLRQCHHLAAKLEDTQRSLAVLIGASAIQDEWFALECFGLERF
jgi:hypothetical protein